MARCRCAAGTCECHLIAGPNITVTGAGDATDPWVITGGAVSSGTIIFQDGGEVAFDVAGNGLPTEPYVVTAELPWVNPAEGQVGEVLAKKSDGSWGPAAPVTTAPGLIDTGQGITGDGSSGNALRLCLSSYDDLKAAAAC